MRKGLIDMLINHLLLTRVGYALSDDPEEVKCVKEIDSLIDELQKMKDKKKRKNPTVMKIRSNGRVSVLGR